MKPTVPWKGPCVDGISQSLLSRYLACPERFWIQTILGLREIQNFSHRMEYGSMFHLCEERHMAGYPWKAKLQEYCKELGMTYSTARLDIQKWYHICQVQFPIYVEWWKNHESTKYRVEMFSEEKFKVNYKLPSGRTVILRGMFDNVSTIKKFVCLQENKVKGDINQDQILAELPSNLQTMIYCTALQAMDINPGMVRYNIIRRPLSDWRGQFNIKQKKGRKTKKGIIGSETTDEYHKRLGRMIADNGEHFFMRWTVPVEKVDIQRFRIEILDPILDNLVDDYEWWSHCVKENKNRFDSGIRVLAFPGHRHRHFRLPFGVYNPIVEGRPGTFAEFIHTGSTKGLEPVTNLFPELT